MIFRLFSLIIPLLIASVLAANPAWWTDAAYQFIDPNKTANDSGPVVQGQLKYAVSVANAYLDAELIQFGGSDADGLGGLDPSSLDDLLASSFFSSSTNDLVVIKNGQLKYMAAPFYRRFDELGIPLSLIGFSQSPTEIFPWTATTSDDVDLAPALLGQLKYVFSFDLSLSGDGDVIPDWWEYKFGTDPTTSTDNTSTDTDGDFILDAVEYTNKSDPTDYYNGNVPSLTIVSGNGQTVAPGASLQSPVIIEAQDGGLNPLNNAPITVSVAESGAGTVTDTVVTENPSITVRTNSSGQSEITFNAAASYLGNVTLNFLAQSGQDTVSVNATLSVIQAMLQWGLFAGPNQSFVINDESTQAIHGAGDNQFGHIAGQSTPQLNTFTDLDSSSISGTITKIVASDAHVIALTNLGEVYVWGDNFSGELGLGASELTGKTTPTKIGSLSSVVDVAAGDGFSCFLVDDGANPPVIYLAGDLSGGIAGSTQLELDPVAFDMSVFTGGNLAAITASGRRLLARDSSGSVWAWGDNRFGQSDPDSIDFFVSTPVMVISAGAIAMHASPDVSLALLDNGSLRGWGNNSFGQLGPPSKGSTSTPLTDLATSVTEAVAGNGFIAYVTASNELYTAGLNDQSQLGRDTTGAQFASTGVVTLPSVDAIVDLSVGDRHVFYLTNATIDPLYGFGDNRSGALGDINADPEPVLTVQTPTVLVHNF